MKLSKPLVLFSITWFILSYVYVFSTGFVVGLDQGYDSFVGIFKSLSVFEKIAYLTLGLPGLAVDYFSSLLPNTRIFAIDALVSWVVILVVGIGVAYTLSLLAWKAFRAMRSKLSKKIS
ncbi:MAG TPA: hypothetical protein VIH52_03245 [Candidatus Nanoarchaeia archaeon]|nr:hypothetical protein [uncultured archaeon]